MIDIIEIMQLFNLDEKPYVQLGCEWCRDGSSIFFVEDSALYGAIQGDVVGTKEGIVCLMNDVQQFLGWQPAVFSENLEISYDEFELKYEDEM